jgi:hypothetical protein
VTPVTIRVGKRLNDVPLVHKSVLLALGQSMPPAFWMHVAIPFLLFLDTYSHVPSVALLNI